MFSKILIANRGEIACRVIKTAKKMGIATVAVYSDADRDAVHVEMADEAVHIGPSPAAQSYLVAEKIIEACKATGAQAVHPGYGFLSERASFCAALEAEGIVFIGPKPKAIEAMGDKIESKKFANAARVSTVPGYLDVIEDAAHAERIAGEIGYPVMIKASAGGGGKGMRIAWESRIYAEDPYRNFLPSIGRLTRYLPPYEVPHGAAIVRNDTGVTEGSEISMFYDPMIAKLCTWAPTREQAIDAMSDALDGFVVDGIQHNMPFLAALMQHPRWREGRLSTGFIAEEYPEGFHPVEPDEDQTAVLAAVAVSVHAARGKRLASLSGRLRPATDTSRHEWVVKVGDSYLPVAVDDAGRVVVGEREPVHVASDWLPGDEIWRGRIGGREVTAQIRPRLNGVAIAWRGLSVDALVMQPHVARLEKLMPKKAPADTSKLLLCPMPGLVVSIAVAEGQEVKAGETLAVVEAMKMENVLRAERDLAVSKIVAKQGDSLAVDAVIMEFA